MPKHADGPPISSGPYRKHWQVPGLVYDERTPERSVPVEEENKAKLHEIDREDQKKKEARLEESAARRRRKLRR